MAEVTPPGPAGSPKEDTPGTILGVLAGVFGSFGGILIFVFFSLGHPSSGCQRNVLAGVTELAVVGGLAVLAWHLGFRVRGGSFGLSFLRGLTMSATIMALIPWPCSLGWWVVRNLTCLGA
ncbi:MAG TPA: hypothetical protein VGD01_12980 [Candidatus Elarobacter sp.]|jgi:hypothetical protein